MIIDFNYKNKQGVVLITVIIFIIIMSILSVSLLFVMTNEARMTENNIRRIKANYAAQAGFQHYLEILKSNTAPGQISIPVDGITVTANMFTTPASDPTCPQGDQTVACIKAVATY